METPIGTLMHRDGFVRALANARLWREYLEKSVMEDIRDAASKTSMSAVCRELEVNRTWLYKWMSGRRQISDEKLLQMARSITKIYSGREQRWRELGYHLGGAFSPDPPMSRPDPCVPVTPFSPV